MPYTENDVYYSIQDGNIYKIPNIECSLTEINNYIYHPYPDDREFDISFKTMYAECELGSPDNPITEGYMYFKDGSYIKLVLEPDWSTGTLPLVTNMRFSAYFGIKDPTTGTITDYLIATATGLPATKRYWYLSPITPTTWEMEEIVYQTGDKFRLYFGWWSDATPKLRLIFVPYTAGGGEFSLELYNNRLSRNTLSSGTQTALDISTVQGQIIASYLCGDYSGSTEYPDDSSSTGGGDGDFYVENEDIDYTEIPTIQAIDFGFNTIYNPNEGDLRALGDWLWSDDFSDNIKMNFASPFENILTLAIVPLPDDMIETERSTLWIGNTNSHIETFKVTNQYVELDCGEKDINEYWGNFLDYNSQFVIWLPYIGFRALKPDDLVSGKLGVRYVIDLLTGSTVCEIRTRLYDPYYKQWFKHVLYNYNTNIFYNIALSGANYTTMYSQQLNAVSSGINSAIGAVGQIAGGITEGNPVSAIGGVASLFTGLAKSNMEYKTAKPDYGRAGTAGGNTGLFSKKIPYIVRTIPRVQAPENYKSMQGIPSQIYSKLEDLNGYTEVEKVITDTLVSCTADEKAEIINLLQRGVVL